MIHFDEQSIKQMGVRWSEVVNIIEQAVYCLNDKNYAQPIKPYLRYGNSENRIIAMPAYVGKPFDVAGIKWIASFPNNIYSGLPRAHSVVILNESHTGVPLCSFNTALLSEIRTASVSGLMLKEYMKNIEHNNLTVGIIGWGPIGQNHLYMCEEMFGNNIVRYCVYDINGVSFCNTPNLPKEKIQVVSAWQEAFVNCDIVITCTVADTRYINVSPKKGALLLNVSLRDYTTDIYPFVKNSIIVDDWDEVCRENTDIEVFYKERGLKKEDTKTIVDVVVRNVIFELKKNNAIMFNPMGMAVFDVAVAKYYYDYYLNDKKEKGNNHCCCNN